MKANGYCCGKNFAFLPKTLLCFNCDCRIEKDQTYFLNSEKNMIYCKLCHKILQQNLIEFVECENNAELIPEKFVICVKCHRKEHLICILYFETPYFCKCCQNNMKNFSYKNLFTAKQLPTTQLTIDLEKRVTEKLEENKHGNVKITIRMLSCLRKETAVLPFKKDILPKDADNLFPYQAKAIFAFEEIDGVDVCFFGMHVQEYGSECPLPNKNRAFLAYIDSVKFFRPANLRTKIYYEILLGYINHIKGLQFEVLNFRVASPGRDNYYIFYRRPGNQKVPDQDKLEKWYRDLLDHARNEDIVINYYTIRHDKNISNVFSLPYYDSDYFQKSIENNIDKIEQRNARKEQRNIQQEAGIFSQESYNSSIEKELMKNLRGEKENLPYYVVYLKENPSHKDRRTSLGFNSLFSNISEGEHQDKTREAILDESTPSILNESMSACSLSNVEQMEYAQDVDPEILISSNLMDGCEKFLDIASKHYLEFSSLRRAKFSTMVMLFLQHVTQYQKKFPKLSQWLEEYIEINI